MSTCKNYLLSAIGIIFLMGQIAALQAEELKLGFVGSLTSFAGNYGQAVLEGAELAIEDLNHQGVKAKLIVEDDQSVSKNSVSSYIKLANVDRVQAVIAGTWWANAFVKQAERDGKLLLSCETLYNEDVVEGKTYFIMNGDLHTWISIYEPLFQKQGWKKAAIVRYASGFGATLATALKESFSSGDRQYLGAIEYADVEMAEAAAIALKIKKLNPEVLYIDAQPASLANLLKRMAELGLTNITILTNSIANEVHSQKLADLSQFKSIYFTQRAGYSPEFIERFQKKYGKLPYLGADLGYSTTLLAARALQTPDPLAALRSGIKIDGQLFSFDAHQVYAGIPQKVFTFRNAQVEAVGY